MKKIININFQGRVIPIEDTAYHILKQYIESLRVYFAKEEGRDEIINDIESRIAELFSDRLKKVTTCITDEDVNSVIASIGRPQDLEEAEGAQTNAGTAPDPADNAGARNFQQGYRMPIGSHRLYRSANDKLLGGVAAGLANYFGIDPALMRLLFVLFFFTGFGILLYFALWILVPSKSLVNNVLKRLYRNPDNRMIAGVSGGISAYLNIDVWIPRIIFLLPFILAALSNIFTRGWLDFNPVPHFLFNGLGGTLLVIYIVLWIVLPEATTATEKLEMRGEKVDLESIKKTVNKEIENLKGRADKVGGEMKERAAHFSSQVKQAGQHLTVETAPLARRTASGLARGTGLLFRAFFLFIAGMVAFVLLMGLIALVFGGIGVFPFKTFILNGFWENLLAWAALLLFLCIPVIALLVWLIRRLMGFKSRGNYLGYTFGSLWIIGLVSAILLSALIARDFRSKTSVKEDLDITQPQHGKMLVNVSEDKVKYYGSDWFGFDGDLPFFSENQNSILITSVRLQLNKSNDSFYHMYTVKFSNGRTPTIAEALATRINFKISQTDSMLYLPKGFTITRNDKFRNQQVMLVLEVPVGKKIEVDEDIRRYKWFSVTVNRRNGFNLDFDDKWDNDWESEKEYVMTPEGLEPTEKISSDKENDEENKPGSQDQSSDDTGTYRYKGRGIIRDTVFIIRPDSITIKTNHTSTTRLQKKEQTLQAPRALYTLLMIN